MSEQDANAATNEAADEPTEQDILEAVLETEGEGAEDKAGQDADELEDAEIDGKKVRVTKGYKEYLLREQDYRHKTHANGERERALADKDRELSERAKVVAAITDEIADIRALDKQIKAYDDITPEQWLQWRNEDRDAADNAQFAHRLLQDKRAKLAGAIEGKIHSAREAERAVQEGRKAAMEKALKEALPDWTEEREKTVKSHVAQRYGFQPDEVDGILNIVGKDPRVMRLLSDMHKQDTAMKAARDRIAKAKSGGDTATEPPAPIRRVTGNGANANNGKPTNALLKTNPDAWDRAFMADRKRHFGR